MKSINESISADIVVVGIAIATSPEKASQDIPRAWGQFMSAGGPAQWPALAAHRSDDAIYAVYCDYQKDSAAPYTMVIGVAVDAATALSPAVPKNLRRVCIPHGNYARFDPKGDPSQVISPTWNYVNTEWTERGRRRYVADFERYSGEPSAPIQSLFIGLS